MTSEAFAGEPLEPSGEVIEIKVSELKRLFNAMDPAPFRERDLDPAAEEFIVSWARELARDVPVSLLVHLDRPKGLEGEVAALRSALQQFFRERSVAARRNQKQLLRRGRISLLIGLSFLSAAIGAGELMNQWLRPSGVINLLSASLSIGGWVAMWRPIEIFLYDWWPIAAEARLHDRLAVMSVRIRYATEKNADAWQYDWPATPVGAASSGQSA